MSGPKAKVFLVFMLQFDDSEDPRPLCKVFNTKAKAEAFVTLETERQIAEWGEALDYDIEAHDVE